MAEGAAEEGHLRHGDAVPLHRVQLPGGERGEPSGGARQRREPRRGEGARLGGVLVPDVRHLCGEGRGARLHAGQRRQPRAKLFIKKIKIIIISKFK